MSEPYATGPGSVPVDTSMEREARVRGREGTIRRRALAAVEAAGEAGLTSQDIGGLHQSYSAAFSGLYRQGLIVRLAAEQRHGHGVFVTPEHVAGRQVVEYVSLRDRAYRQGYEDGKRAAEAEARAEARRDRR